MSVTRGMWIVIALAFAGTFLPGESVVAQSAEANSGWMKDFDTAQSESQRLNRPLLIHFHAEWCIPCRRMDRDVLSSPELAEQFQQAFVGVKVDADRHPDLLKRFGVRSLPADVVVSPAGKLLIQTRGYQEKKTYVARLDQLGQRFRPPPGNPVPLEKPDGSLLARDQNSVPPIPPARSLSGLEGFSPVSLYNWREWRKGDAQFTAYYKGVAYQMVTREELDEFTADPDKFVPRLLGCDPVILLQSDRAVQGNTKYGAYFDGALYLFQSPETRTEFKKAPMRYIKTRHVLNIDEIEGGETRQSAKPSAPTDPVRQ